MKKITNLYENPLFDKIKSVFEPYFLIPFSTVPIPDIELYSVYTDNWLVGSEEALRNPILSQGEMHDFEDKEPSNYFMVGFWGHGVNSYAFYYVNSNNSKKIYFRLPYGGVYSDNDEDASNIGRFLPTYFALDEYLSNAGYTITAVESMGHGNYIFSAPNGNEYKIEKSIIRDSDFVSLYRDIPKPPPIKNPF